MKKVERFLQHPTVVVLVTIFVLFGCRGKSTDPSEAAFTTLTTHLKNASLDLPNILGDLYVTADALNANLSDYYVMDLRSSADYAAGHIQGAVNVSLANVLDSAANSNSKTIVAACYSGQSAAFAVAGLRLSGYSTAKSLKFGMSSWDSTLDKWTANCATTTSSSWTTDAIATPAEHASPTITTSSSNGATILSERVVAMLSGGFQGIASSTVLAAPDNYFVNVYWDSASVSTLGHVAGAHRIKEDLSIANDGFKYLNPSDTIVTYCWTGQSASAVTAYLTVLGYTAKSIKFGANSMIYDNLTTGKWSGSGSYPLVTD